MSNVSTSVARAERDYPAVTAQQMKGIGFANVHAYVQNKHSEAKWAQVLATLPKEDGRIVGSAVAVGWYDVGLFGRLLRAVDKVCGRGDLQLMEEIGRFEAEQDLNRVLRVFIRVLSPLQIFRVEGRLWSHFQDSGKWESRRVPNGVDATLTGWAVDGALCAELAGYLVRLVEFTGGKDVRVLHATCRAKGHDSCVFQYRWRGDQAGH
jgi:predicted hydrocarbon binding protein